MKPKTRLTILLALAAVGCMCLFSADVQTTKPDLKVEEIKRRHKDMCDLSRNGIQAGYLACRLGIPLTNYLADVEAAWDKQLKEKITEAQKR